MLYDIFNRGALTADADTFEAALRGQGWTSLLQHKSLNGPPVVTILAAPAGDTVTRLHRGSDTGFACYAEMAFRTPNPHFQTVHWHGFLTDGHVTFMDRLHPWQGATVPSATRRLIDKVMEINYFVAETHEEDVWEEEVLPRYRGREVNTRNLRAVMRQLHALSPTLHDAYVSLERCALALGRRDHKFSAGTPWIETNDENIMLRRTPVGWTVVLSDPFFYDHEDAASPVPPECFAPFRSVFERSRRPVRSSPRQRDSSPVMIAAAPMRLPALIR